MLSYYLPITLISEVYPYMSWDTLYYYSDVPNSIWKRCCKKFGVTTRNIDYKMYFLTNIISNLYLYSIPSHLWTNRHFIHHQLKVRKNGVILRYIPENLRTKEIVLTAIQFTENLLDYIPTHLWNDMDFIHQCLSIRKDGTILKYIPSNLKTKEIILSVFDSVPNILASIMCEYIPYDIRIDIDIIHIVLKKSVYILRWVPQTFIVDNILSLVSINARSIQYIYTEYRRKN